MTTKGKKGPRTKQKLDPDPAMTNGRKTVIKAGKGEGEMRLPTRPARDVMIIKPGEGKTYAEILGRLKAKVNLDETKAVVKTIRKTQSGGFFWS